MTPVDLFTIAEAWASAAGEHDAPAATGVIFPFLNFLIYAGIIVYFVLPLVRDYLRSRRGEIVAALQAAADSKRRAEAMVNDYRGRLARVGQEGASLQAALRSDGEREKGKLLAEAEMTATKIRQDARFLADQEVKMARQRIRQEIATQAEGSARELIQRHLSAADQDRLAEAFVHDIGQSR